MIDSYNTTVEKLDVRKCKVQTYNNSECTADIEHILKKELVSKQFPIFILKFCMLRERTYELLLLFD